MNTREVLRLYWDQRRRNGRLVVGGAIWRHDCVCHQFRGEHGRRLCGMEIRTPLSRLIQKLDNAPLVPWPESMGQIDEPEVAAEGGGFKKQPAAPGRLFKRKTFRRKEGVVERVEKERGRRDRGQI